VKEFIKTSQDFLFNGYLPSPKPYSSFPPALIFGLLLMLPKVGRAVNAS